MPQLLGDMAALAPQWMRGSRLRPCWFLPTFHKHAGEACAGVQIHVDDGAYDHEAFRPYRLVALFLKAVRRRHSERPLWRHFTYEYESGRLAIDLINGGPSLREWVDDPAAAPADLDAICEPDERSWLESRRGVLLYPA